MRQRLIGLTLAAGMAPAGLAQAQEIVAVAPAPAGPESRITLRYTRWDAAPDETRRWQAPPFARVPERWAETKAAPRSARIGYALGGQAEVFMGVTKTRKAKAGQASEVMGAAEAGRDWKDIQDRRRKAYSIGITTKW